MQGGEGGTGGGGGGEGQINELKITTTVHSDTPVSAKPCSCRLYQALFSVLPDSLIIPRKGIVIGCLPVCLSVCLSVRLSCAMLADYSSVSLS